MERDLIKKFDIELLRRKESPSRRATLLLHAMIVQEKQGMLAWNVIQCLKIQYLSDLHLELQKSELQHLQVTSPIL